MNNIKIVSIESNFNNRRGRKIFLSLRLLKLTDIGRQLRFLQHYFLIPILHQLLRRLVFAPAYCLTRMDHPPPPRGSVFMPESFIYFTTYLFENSPTLMLGLVQLSPVLIPVVPFLNSPAISLSIIPKATISKLSICFIILAIPK